MPLFLLWKIKKKDILKNVVNQTVLVTIEIHCVDINTYISNFLKEEKCHAGLEWHEGVLNYNIILLYLYFYIYIIL